MIESQFDGCRWVFSAVVLIFFSSSVCCIDALSPVTFKRNISHSFASRSHDEGKG